MAETKRILIVDASVVIKWILKETEFLEQALHVKEDIRNGKVKVHVPSHFISEIANTLCRKFGTSALSFISYILTADFFEEHSISLTLARKACEIMVRYKGLSFYDAAYHGLAIATGGTFVTADAAYFAKTKEEGSILLLQNYK